MTRQHLAEKGSLRVFRKISGRRSENATYRRIRSAEGIGGHGSNARRKLGFGGKKVGARNDRLAGIDAEKEEISGKVETS